MELRGATAVASGMGAGNAAARPAFLADTLGALESAGLRYCVLRNPTMGPVAARRREIDLLVDARDLRRFRRLVFELGFVPLISWGYGGHRPYAAYEEGAGAWLKLDVVTSLRYGGESRPLSSRALAGCLDRRRHMAGLCLPEPVDGLLGLLLHDLLDKGAFKEAHREELRRLQAAVEADEALRTAVGERFHAALGRALPWSQASAAIAAGTWERLLQRRRRIAWTLFQGEPAGSAWRWLGGGLARLVRPGVVAWRHRGFSVALMGPDGSGKTTLARALAEDAQLRARIVYMGSNPSASTVGLPWTRWIERGRKGHLAGRSPGMARLLGGITLANRFLEQAYRSLVAWGWGLRGRLVVFDRHPYELLLAEPTAERVPKLRRWLLARACVRPDLVLLLDAPPETLRSRKSEHTLESLKKQRQRYRSLPFRGPRVLALDATATVEEMVRRTTSMIWSRYRERFADQSGTRHSGVIPERRAGVPRP